MTLLPEYIGNISYRVKDAQVRKAYFSYRNQKYRCYSKNNKSYKNYGGRGITVNYTCREFVSWWLFHVNQKEWKDPTVGRIDHDGPYSFENIEMQERADNTAEVHKRRGQCGGPKKKRVIAYWPNGIVYYESTREAARKLGIHQSFVIRNCAGLSKNKNFLLRYDE